MGDGEEDWCPIKIDLEKLVIGQILPVEKRYAENHKNEIVQYFDEKIIGTYENYEHYPTLNTYIKVGERLFHASRSDSLPKWTENIIKISLKKK
jgi:hypothetical protein